MVRQKQKNIAVPLDYWERFEKLYETHEEKLKVVEIDSPIKLLKVLANFGVKPFLEFLEGKRPISEFVAEVRKFDKVSKESQKKP